MDRDFYQIDAMCNGLFPQYKLEEYADQGIKIVISESDKKCLLRAKLILLA